MRVVIEVIETALCLVVVLVVVIGLGLSIMLGFDILDGWIAQVINFNIQDREDAVQRVYRNYRVGASVRVCNVDRGMSILLAPRRLDEPWPATRSARDSMPVTVIRVEITPAPEPAAGERRQPATYVIVGRSALGVDVRSTPFYGINAVRLCEYKGR